MLREIKYDLPLYETLNRNPIWVSSCSGEILSGIGSFLYKVLLNARILIKGLKIKRKNKTKL